MAELTACNAGTEVEVADTDAVVLDSVCEVIVTLCHSTNEDGDALILVEAANVVAQTNNLGVETEGDLAAVGGKVIGNGVLDDFDEFFLG